MSKTRVIIFVLMSALILIPLAYCQEQNQQHQIKTVHGKVLEVDWVGSKLALKDVDEFPNDQLVFMVSEKVKIYRGTEELSLGDLEMENRVAVEYYDNGFAGLKAVSITVSQ